jgi:hypothetical protein
MYNKSLTPEKYSTAAIEISSDQTSIEALGPVLVYPHEDPNSIPSLESAREWIETPSTGNVEGYAPRLDRKKVRRF